MGDLMMKMMMIIKIIKNNLRRMREMKYRKIIIKRQEGKFKIIKLLKGLERNQKRKKKMKKSVKIKYKKKKKKKKRWSLQNPKEDGVEKKIKKEKKRKATKNKISGGYCRPKMGQCSRLY